MGEEITKNQEKKKDSGYEAIQPTSTILYSFEMRIFIINYSLGTDHT